MHPADIKAAIEKAGSSQADIARSVPSRGGNAISRTAVFMVLRGISKSRTVALRISKVTGIPVGQLWPGKYPDLEKLDAITRAKPSVAKHIDSDRAAHAAKTTTTKRRAA
jgi:lambda repressor-like predicted transcriptional regulator